MIEYERLIALDAPVHDFFPEIYGFVATDLGPGLCVERLRGDEIEGPVPRVITVARRRVEEGLSIDSIINGVRDLAEFCVEFQVLATCAGLENIGVARRNGIEKVVAFDFKAHYNKEFIPVSTYIPFFRRMKIARRFDRIIRDLKRRVGDQS